ncbi:MAG: peptidyl-tRNA hydrolase Pth2 [Candidatus Aenigmarchaeota archaeon]|nr:peptidyl-tRNA hydrolase Pth2 [Candidatus Aenigmarchaeota archaeon]MDW8149723.1 peptidyl-tRNA hydrolase Pth2 [Candidatus Aenigmarchaeota archaeon]
MQKFKQVIIVRKDLKMSKGKLAVQCCHACIGALRQVEKEIIEKWEREGAKKIILKVKNLEELKEIEKKLKKNKIKYFLVIDAGKTQLEKETITCIGIGPIEEKKIDKITGRLKLL